MIPSYACGQSCLIWTYLLAISLSVQFDGRDWANFKFNDMHVTKPVLIVAPYAYVAGVEYVSYEELVQSATSYTHRSLEQCAKEAPLN